MVSRAKRDKHQESKRGVIEPGHACNVRGTDAGERGLRQYGSADGAEGHANRMTEQGQYDRVDGSESEGHEERRCERHRGAKTSGPFEKQCEEPADENRLDPRIGAEVRDGRANAVHRPALGLEVVDAECRQDDRHDGNRAERGFGHRSCQALPEFLPVAEVIEPRPGEAEGDDQAHSRRACSGPPQPGHEDDNHDERRGREGAVEAFTHRVSRGGRGRSLPLHAPRR